MQVDGGVFIAAGSLRRQLRRIGIGLYGDQVVDGGVVDIAFALGRGGGDAEMQVLVAIGWRGDGQAL